MQFSVVNNLSIFNAISERFDIYLLKFYLLYLLFLSLITNEYFLYSPLYFSFKLNTMFIIIIKTATHENVF